MTFNLLVPYVIKILKKTQVIGPRPEPTIKPAPTYVSVITID